jgi:hypothetical protein
MRRGNRASRARPQLAARREPRGKASVDNMRNTRQRKTLRRTYPGISLDPRPCLWHQLAAVDLDNLTDDVPRQDGRSEE